MSGFDVFCRFKEFLFSWSDGRAVALWMASLACSIMLAAPVAEATTNKTIAGGGLHSLHKKKDGSLWASGSGSYGQLGTGNYATQRWPVKVGTDNDWVAVAAGLDFSLGLKANGTLWAWGNNEYGQLGLGAGQTANIPRQVGVASNWMQISAGDAHALAVKADGTLWAWGYNGMGQLGLNNSAANVFVPTRVGIEANWAGATAGGYHSIGLRTDGSLWGWGYNASRQLGVGASADQAAPVRIGTADNWTAASAGNQHTLAVTADGRMWGWGDNSFKQILSSNTSLYSAPINISSAGIWVAVSAGDRHSSAMQANGSLWTWGANNFGQVGNGTTASSASMAAVPNPNGIPWAALESGINQTLAVNARGDLFAWGINSSYQLGDGTPTNRTLPTYITDAYSRAAVQATFARSFLITVEADLLGWGSQIWSSSTQAQLAQTSTPTLIGSGFRQVSPSRSGNNLNHLIGVNGSLWGFGAFVTSVMPPACAFTASRSTFNAPTAYNNGSDWISISEGSDHRVAIRQGGQLWSWGDNCHFQQANTTEFYRLNPARIGTESKWVAVSAGIHFNHVLAANGSLFAWGGNEYGQVGIGSTGDQEQLMQVGPAGVWRKSSAGGYHSAAIRGNGTLWTWGNNQLNQLGVCGSAVELAPKMVGKEIDWVTVSAGDFHTLALRANGTLWVWGNNTNGELGLGHKNPVCEPVRLGTDNNWVAISAGGGHSLAIKADGSVWAWGNGTGGQVGGSPASSTWVPRDMGKIWR